MAEKKETKKSAKWMGVQTAEMYRSEIRKMFEPVINSIRDDIKDAQSQIEEKAWELLGSEAYNAWRRKKELEKELSDVEEVLRKFNGGACSYNSGRSYGYDSYDRSKKTLLEDAKWQAKQIMFGEADEIEEMKADAIRNVTFCESPSEVRSLVKEIAKNLKEFQKRYRNARRI